jgi:hypothetical protein
MKSEMPIHFGVTGVEASEIGTSSCNRQSQRFQAFAQETKGRENAELAAFDSVDILSCRAVARAGSFFFSLKKPEG